MIYRGKIDNIIFEFSLAKDAKCNLVICDGLPSVPKQKELLTYLSDNGCNVFYPRYRGTWESGGEFLSKTPTDDIMTLVDTISFGEVIELYNKNKFSVNLPIYLIGSSFGGAVALSLVENSKIEKVVAVSPIVDFKKHNNNGKEQDLNFLGEFIAEAFGEGYRFKKDNWGKMLVGDLFNPPENINVLNASKILISYDLSDNVIDSEKVLFYAKKNNIKTLVSENVGHLSFSKISDVMWKDIFHFLYN